MIAAIRSKLIGLLSIFFKITKPEFWKTTVSIKIREFFTKLLDVKPKDKTDYYHVFRWLISKKLAFAIVVFVGAASLYYIIMFSPARAFFGEGGNDSLHVYKYNSLPIRFYSGDCRVKARDGHIAYEGVVEKGVVTGAGKLYSKAGDLIYMGEFDANRYNGTGTLYADDGTVLYEGGFQDNLYNGSGKLYYESGSLHYAGMFNQGRMNGEGVLYNAVATPIFSGNFVMDEIAYPEFVGKSAAESAAMYTGSQMVYAAFDGEYVVSMPEISAIQAMTNAEEALEAEGKVSETYVTKDSIVLAGKEMSSITELNAYFGTADYAGYTYATIADAIAVNALGDSSPFGAVDITTESVFEDARTVTEFDNQFEIYIHAYKKDGNMYSFYTTGPADKKFALYSVGSSDEK
jgi:hypothetical protein